MKPLNENRAKKKIFIALGTRPEVIKCYPLWAELKKYPEFNTRLCVFRQQKGMLDQTLTAFHMKPDFIFSVSLGDKGLLGAGKNIFLLVKSGVQAAFGLFRFVRMLRRERPDFLVVQGDTSTAFLASFLAINFKVPVAHVEAGLRTQTKYSPFPEEINRRLISVLADFHFAPTAKARENLLREGIDEERIIVTGNTALDTLRLTLKSDCPFKDGNNIKIDPDKKLLIVTAHRRESFGEGMKNIAEAIREIAEKRSDIVIVYPVHANPNVSKPMRSMLGGCKNIFLVDPMEYHAFVALMKKAYMILTDSGGIQEEVSFLGKPTLVMRESTERPEGLMGGNVRLVGTDKGLIVGEVTRLLDDATYYQSMSKTHAAFGDGFAAQKIITAFQDYFQKNLHT